MALAAYNFARRLAGLLNKRLSNYEVIYKDHTSSEAIPGYQALDILRCIPSRSNPHIAILSSTDIEMLERVQVHPDMQVESHQENATCPPISMEEEDQHEIESDTLGSNRTGHKRKPTSDLSTLSLLSGSKRAKPI